MAYGMGDAKYSQTYLEVPIMPSVKKRQDIGGARRLVVQTAEPAPTIMAGGVGSVNTSQYRLGDDLEPEKDVSGKPPYRVPTMAEIASIPDNGFRVASTFSGCGGSSLGYRMAGFRVLWANEFVEAARESYLANCAESTIVDGRDIRQVKPEDILKAIKLRKGQLDLLDGSPPCASFSTAGKRQAGWGQVKKYSDTSQRTDDLFFEFARILEGVQPKTFVAENVSGLVKGTAKGYFLEILQRLKDCGYKVRAALLDAQWLGVPQCRVRTIFVGVRNDLRAEPCHPQPLPYRYSVRDAIPWISGTVVSGQPGKLTREPTIDAQSGRSSVNGRIQGVVTNSAGKERLRSLDEPSPTVTKSSGGAGGSGRGGEIRGVKITHDGPDGTKTNVPITGPCPTVRAGSAQRNRTDQFIIEAESDMSKYATGAEWEKIAPGGQSEKYFQLVKPSLTDPCPTVTAAGGNAGLASVCHPTERRKFSIAELRRICAFPDDFILTGSYAAQWERLGRAVPPVMMKYIAETVRDQILRRLK